MLASEHPACLTYLDIAVPCFVALDHLMMLATEPFACFTSNTVHGYFEV